ncbi:arginine--tRNA ligase [Candidatus Heimdallarchaeota archaeon]|nr:MAG: arginine--tRNA ligase [Candidatus Heimdallarchaeota archaeon]
MTKKHSIEVIKQSIEKALLAILKEKNIEGISLPINESPSKSGFGDYCIPVFSLAKELKKAPKEIAKEIASIFPKLELFEKVTSEGGFVNIKLNRSYCSCLILSEILEKDDFYQSSNQKGKKIIIEHTSANPNGPIHIGNFRGSVIGDTYANILKALGAKVQTNFYVDDLGHQIPVLVLGYDFYKKYSNIPTDAKIDHFLGRIYGITHTMYDIQRFKKELREKYDLRLGLSPYWFGKEEEEKLENFSHSLITKQVKQQLLKRFSFLYNVQLDIYHRFKDIYRTIKDAFEKEEIDLVEKVLLMNKQYVLEKTETVNKIRGTCEDALRGQKEELAIMGITHNHYDWESTLQWSGAVEEIVTTLESKGFLIKDGKARLFNANKAANLEGARKHLNLKPSYEVPNPILINSNGESLYPLRDIAYSLKKADDYQADYVYNVIGKGQELTQIQVNLAVRAIGREDVANKMEHLNYEFIELKGAISNMSARRLQYITPLELLEKTEKAILSSFLEQRDYTPKEKKKIARIVAVGAIKYSIIARGLLKKMVFDPMEVISLKDNTSPFIQYAYARSQNILAKKQSFKWTKSKNSNLETLKEDEEWQLILLLMQFPIIVQKAGDEIKPELLCNYLFDVATLFNKFYDSHRVLDAPTEKQIIARLGLTMATGKVLEHGLELLNIDSPKKM